MNTVLRVLLLITIVVANDLPSNFQKCKRSSTELNQCLTKNANAVWSTFIKGDPKFNVPVLSPLKLPVLNRIVPYFVNASLTDATMLGLAGVTFKDLRMDFHEKQMNIKFNQPLLQLTGHCTFNGHFLGSPIHGDTKISLIYENGDYNYYFNYDLIKKSDGKEYLNITKSDMTYEVQGMRGDAQDLFPDNRELGRQIIKLVNDNWKIAHELIKEPFGEIFAEVYSSAISGFFHTVPFMEMYEW